MAIWFVVQFVVFLSALFLHASTGILCAANMFSTPHANEPMHGVVVRDTDSLVQATVNQSNSYVQVVGRVTLGPDRFVDAVKEATNGSNDTIYRTSNLTIFADSADDLLTTDQETQFLDFGNTEEVLTMGQGTSLTFMNLTMRGVASKYQATRNNSLAIANLGLDVWPSVQVEENVLVSFIGSQTYRVSNVCNGIVPQNWSARFVELFGEGSSYVDAYGRVVIRGDYTVALRMWDSVNPDKAKLGVYYVRYKDSVIVCLLDPFAPQDKAPALWDEDFVAVISADNPYMEEDTEVSVWVWISWAIPLGVILVSCMPCYSLIKRRLWRRRLLRATNIEPFRAVKRAKPRGSPVISSECFSSDTARGAASTVASMYKKRMTPAEGLIMGPMIGRGSFGKVYKCKWRGVTVAVKIVDVGKKKGEEVEGMTQEMIVCTTVVHPNVVTTYKIWLQPLPLASSATTSSPGGPSGSQSHSTTMTPRGQGSAGNSPFVSLASGTVPRRSYELPTRRPAPPSADSASPGLSPFHRTYSLPLPAPSLLPVSQMATQVPSHVVPIVLNNHGGEPGRTQSPAVVPSPPQSHVTGLSGLARTSVARAIPGDPGVALSSIPGPSGGPMPLLGPPQSGGAQQMELVLQRQMAAASRPRPDPMQQDAKHDFPAAVAVISAGDGTRVPAMTAEAGGTRHLPTTGLHEGRPRDASPEGASRVPMPQGTQGAVIAHESREDGTMDNGTSVMAREYVEGRSTHDGAPAAGFPAGPVEAVVPHRQVPSRASSVDSYQTAGSQSREPQEQQFSGVIERPTGFDRGVGVETRSCGGGWGGGGDVIIAACADRPRGVPQECGVVRGTGAAADVSNGGMEGAREATRQPAEVAQQQAEGSSTSCESLDGSLGLTGGQIAGGTPQPTITHMTTQSQKSSIAENVPSTSATAGPSSSDGTANSSSVIATEMWMVMEYCDKGSIHSGLQSNVFHNKHTGQPNMDVILLSLLDVSSGMEYLHSCDFIHGDLKSANVLLSSSHNTRGFVCKVGDFSMSRILDVKMSHVATRSHGTLAYMAPELVHEGKLTKAADVYSFGILAWELYTAEEAFKGARAGDIIQRVIIQHEKPAVPSDYPEPYRKLLEGCWDTAENRPTFRDIRQAIQRFHAAQRAKQ